MYKNLMLHTIMKMFRNNFFIRNLYSNKHVIKYVVLMYIRIRDKKKKNITYTLGKKI